MSKAKIIRMALLNNAFNPNVLESRATAKQDEVLRDVWSRHKYVIAGNQSGKSSLKARDVTWKLTETHPYWQRPNNKRCMNKLCETEQEGGKPNFTIKLVWTNPLDPEDKENKLYKSTADLEANTVPGDGIADALYSCQVCPTKWMDWRSESLSMIVGSKTSQLTQELWEKKMKPYLYGVKIKIEKSGHAIKKVINIDPDSPGYKNEILFFSHDNAKQASNRVQGVTLHDVWLDELPDDWKLVEELHRRTDAKRAQFCATFTPKTSNPDIRRIIDEGDPSIVSTYRFGMLDNPAYANRKEEQLAALAGMTEALRNCVLYGDWLDADERVFMFNKENNTIPEIKGYKPEWPHVLSVDPAMSSKIGWCVAVWSPLEARWFVIRAEYLTADKDKDSPKSLIGTIERNVSKYNIVRRIYDPANAWWMATAREEFGKTYIPVPSKTTRKKDLIINLIKAIGGRKLMFVGELPSCYDELHRAEWAVDKDHAIKGSTHYHIIDSLQYLLDLLPKDLSKEEKSLTRDELIVKLWREEKKIKEDVKKAKGYDKHRQQRRLQSFRKRPKIW